MSKIFFNEKTTIEYLDLVGTRYNTNQMIEIKTFNPSIPEGLDGELYSLLFNICNYASAGNRICTLGLIKLNGGRCNYTSPAVSGKKLWCLNRYVKIDKFNNYFGLVSTPNYSDIIAPTVVNYNNGSTYNQICGDYGFSEKFITFYYNKDNSFSEITWNEPLKEISDKSWGSYSFDGSLAKYSNGTWNYLLGNKPSNLCCYLLFSIKNPKPKRVLWKD